MREVFDFVKLKNKSRAADTRIPLLPADQAGTLQLNYTTQQKKNKEKKSKIKKKTYFRI